MIETKYKNIFVNEDDLGIYKQKNNGKLTKLTPWIDSCGYYMIAFVVDGKKHWVRVHRLVAEALIPNPNNYPQVNHKDGNKLNYSLDNLEWRTNQYNTQEAYDNGLYKSKKNCPIQTTNKETGQVEIFNSIRSCAKQLGLNRKTVTSILKHEKATNNYNYEFAYI